MTLVKCSLAPGYRQVGWGTSVSTSTLFDADVLDHLDWAEVLVPEHHVEVVPEVVRRPPQLQATLVGVGDHLVDLVLQRLEDERDPPDAALGRDDLELGVAVEEVAHAEVDDDADVAHVHLGGVDREAALDTEAVRQIGADHGRDLAGRWRLPGLDCAPRAWLLDLLAPGAGADVEVGHRAGLIEQVPHGVEVGLGQFGQAQHLRLVGEGEAPDALVQQAVSSPLTVRSMSQMGSRAWGIQAAARLVLDVDEEVVVHLQDGRPAGRDPQWRRCGWRRSRSRWGRRSGPRCPCRPSGPGAPARPRRPGRRPRRAG